MVKDIKKLMQEFSGMKLFKILGLEPPPPKQKQEPYMFTEEADGKLIEWGKQWIKEGEEVQGEAHKVELPYNPPPYMGE